VLAAIVAAALIAALYVAMRRAAARARASDERFRKFMENSPACVFIKDAEGRYVYMNAAAEQLVGTADWRGRHDAELVPPALARHIRENDRRVLEADAAVSFQIAMDGAEGRRHFHSTKFPLREAGRTLVASVTVEVTPQARSAEELRLVADTMPVGVVRCSRDLKYKWVNRVFADWAGGTPEELAGTPIAQRLGEEEMRAVQPYFERVLAGERVEYERLASFPRLGQRWIRAVAAPTFDAAGRPDGWVGVVTDVHERKQMEEALRDADRRKDEFLATLAHELRNPLAPIRQAASIARSENATDAQKRWSSNVIERQVQHMSLLLDDLLDVSRITHGTLQLRRQQTDLQSVVGAAVETARPLIDERQHRLVVDVPANLQVYGDPLRLAQVLSNLLTNAAKYTNPRGDIRVTADEVGGELVMSVEDSGIGIASEDLTKVFGMFAQVRSAQEHAAGGLGIGLALARGIIDLHGGRIEAASGGPGKGSRFTVHLPGASRASIAEPKSRAALNGNAAHKRILLADDNRDAAESLAIILRLEGHEVEVAHDGTAALESFAQQRPDVALLDIGMPKVNGYEVAKEIRARPEGRGVLLIAITGWAQDSDRARSRDAGFDHHLTKPVEPETLIELLAPRPTG
jgi:PAS domain S-box-containing protein